jgi:hypothetical protein
MLNFTSIKTGRKYIVNKNDYWLRKCPCCRNVLHSNKYKDLIVSESNDKDISISIAMEYCEKCDNLFIRNDY